MQAIIRQSPVMLQKKKQKEKRKKKWHVLVVGGLNLRVLIRYLKLFADHFTVPNFFAVRTW